MTNWKKKASEEGFANAHAMLFSLYISKDLSTSAIGTRFAVTGQTVRNALRLYKIALKKRGGKKNARSTAI